MITCIGWECHTDRYGNICGHANFGSTETDDTRFSLTVSQSKGIIELEAYPPIPNWGQTMSLEDYYLTSQLISEWKIRLDGGPVRGLVIMRLKQYLDRALTDMVDCITIQPQYTIDCSQLITS